MATFDFNYDDTATAELDGFTLQARTAPDDTQELPWEREDGHGPVSGWRALPEGRSKHPGELILCGERGHSMVRLYDYAEACRIALRDGWGPKRDGETPRQTAARAAREDFERLRAWCRDDWAYVGVIVTASRDGIELGHASLWGIESDAGDYLHDVAEELAEEAIQEAKATLARLCDCQELAA